MLVPLLISLAVLAGLILLPVAAMAFGAYTSVSSLSRPDLALYPAHQQQFARQYSISAGYHAWATNEGFVWVGGFILPATPQSFIALWRHKTGATYFAVYVIESVVMNEFITEFENDASLDTSSGKDSHLFPLRPGIFVQSFSDLSVEDLYRRHIEGQRYLQEQGRFVPHATNQPLPQRIIQSIQKQVGYVRQHALWPLRAVGWYMIRRHRRHNKSVEELFPAWELNRT